MTPVVDSFEVGKGRKKKKPQSVCSTLGVDRVRVVCQMYGPSGATFAGFARFIKTKTSKQIPHCGTDGDYSCSSPRVHFADGGRYLRVSFSRSPAMEWNQEHFFKHSDEHRRGVCKGFSFGSRRRMLDRLNQVSVAAEMPDFVTLTLPDSAFEDSVTSFSKTAKLHLDVLLKRLHRACPSACGFWRIEWKARKSGMYEGKLFPHFHLLVWGLPQRSLGDDGKGGEWLESFVPVKDCQQSFTGLCQEVLENHAFKSQRSVERFYGRMAAHTYRIEDAEHLGPVRSAMSFFDWVSLSWYHVVGTGNLEHFLAGCRVEKIRTWGGVLSYCAKYMSKADSENFLSDVPTGRSWGIFNRAFVPWAKMVTLDLDEDAGVRIRRIARRYLEHRLGRRVQRHFGITLYCDASQFKTLLARPPDTPF